MDGWAGRFALGQLCSPCVPTLVAAAAVCGLRCSRVGGLLLPRGVPSEFLHTEGSRGIPPYEGISGAREGERDGRLAGFILTPCPPPPTVWQEAACSAMCTLVEEGEERVVPYLPVGQG